MTARAGSRHAERGQVLAEFAVVSLAVLMMVFGIIDCGRALYTYHLVSDDARLGSRYCRELRAAKVHPCETCVAYAAELLRPT